MIYFHKHHIIPKHMGGTDESSNLIKVNTTLHAFLHRLLWEEHKNEYDLIAWKCLSGQITNEEANIQATIVSNKGKIPWNKGKKGVQQSTRKGVARTKDEKKSISEGTKLGMQNTDKKIGAPKNTIPWNKGKKTGKQSPELVQKRVEFMLKSKKLKKEGAEAPSK